MAGQVTPAAAEETGLAAGTPVVGGMFDVDASAIGAGAINPNQACLVMGSWSINEVITQDPIVDPSLFMTTLFAEPGLFLTIEGSATSATNLEWFVNQCCGDERAEAKRRGISVYEVCSEEVASLPPGSTNIIFHPFLYGSNVQPTARAGFYGVAGWHTRAHLLRALYEGVVFGHLSHIEKLRAAGAQINTRAARRRRFAQSGLVADVCRYDSGADGSLGWERVGRARRGLVRRHWRRHLSRLCRSRPGGRVGRPRS